VAHGADARCEAAAMDYEACNVVYVDRAAREEKLVRREDLISSALTSGPLDHVGDGPLVPARAVLNDNMQVLLGTFNEGLSRGPLAPGLANSSPVYICTTGKSCVSKLSELNQASIGDLIPTLVLIDIPYDDLVDGPSGEDRPPSPSSRLQVDNLYNEPDIGNAYGLKLLQCITAEIQYQSLSKLVVPIAVVSTSGPSDVAISHHRLTESWRHRHQLPRLPLVHRSRRAWVAHSTKRGPSSFWMQGL